MRVIINSIGLIPHNCISSSFCKSLCLFLGRSLLRIVCQLHELQNSFIVHLINLLFSPRGGGGWGRWGTTTGRGGWEAKRRDETRRCRPSKSKRAKRFKCKTKADPFSVPSASPGKMGQMLMMLLLLLFFLHLWSSSSRQACLRFSSDAMRSKGIGLLWVLASPFCSISLPIPSPSAHRFISSAKEREVDVGKQHTLTAKHSLRPS